MAKLRRPVDKDKWATEPAVVNAFYNPNKNDIGTAAAAIIINVHARQGHADGLSHQADKDMLICLRSLLSQNLIYASPQKGTRCRKV